MPDSEIKVPVGSTYVPGVVAEPSQAPLVQPRTPLAPASIAVSGEYLDARPISSSLQRMSLWLIVTLVASYTFLDYWTYSADYHLHPAAYDLFLRGEGSAPAQYRIALIFVANVLHRVAHLGFRHCFALFDFVFALGAACLLRSVLAATKAFRAAAPVSRWLSMTAFLALLSFYFSWALWYQRPETMACAFFVAASLYLVTVARSPVLVGAGLVALAAWQGFVRADVAILFHFGLFLFVVVRGSKDFLVSRGVLIGTSMVCCMLPTGILWLLMHRIFPHATYGDTAVFQLLMNLSPGQLVPFFLFMVPTLYTYRRALARFSWLEGPQAALLLICLLYLCSWALVGRLQEVRIFVPFAMGLMPLAANLLADQVARAEA